MSFMKHVEEPATMLAFQVSHNSSVYNLQQVVHEWGQKFLRCDPGELMLYKLRQPEPIDPLSTLRKRLSWQEPSLSDSDLLTPDQRVYDCLPEGSPPGRVSILVGVAIGPTKKRLRRGSDSVDSHPDVKRLKVVDDRITAVEQGVLAKDPSSAAQYMHLSSEQHKYPIKNGRPVDQIGPPLAIYHPVFAKFKGLSTDQKIKPSATEYALVHELLAIAAYIHSEYDDMDARFERMEPILRKLLGDTSAHEIGLYRTTNGICLLTETRSSSAAALSAVIEIRNEVGTDQCDASVKGGMSYRKYWVHEMVWIPYLHVMDKSMLKILTIRADGAYS
ncbi:hypothetical protein A0H81_14491 [Grifola frondosa]|uniref:Uncharacterized protein n=1 Tax=Grifola frondosa TaxID=5627 RepID=A0A1C7LS18_GRIFR|nr:hypothetical protein A0H81_14491 [Grifola frondosa]